MSNPKTLGELGKSLTAYIQGLDAAESIRRINNAYVNEAMGHPWGFLLKRWTLQTEAVYSTGTIAVTNPSTSVTLTGGTWATSWTTSPSSRRLAIQGRFEPYDITIASASTGTLADPWIGASDTDASYSMWRDQHPFPADCGYTKLLGIYDPEYRFRLAFKNQSIFLRDLMVNAQYVNIPAQFTIVDMTTEAPPRPQFRLYPAPAAVRPYWGFYFARPDFLTATSQYLRWPTEFLDMIPLSAAIEHYSTPRFYSQKYLNLYKPTYADMYAKMVKEFDGNAAIDVMIEDIQLGRRRVGNGSWSPNPLAFVGQGMTNS